MNIHFHKFAAATAATVALVLASAGAQAASVTLLGSIASHNSIVNINFSLASAGEVKIWSDSWQSGLNFDPTAAVWASAGSDYTLVQAVDDDDTVGTGQGFYDTGFVFPTLAAGSYRLTLATAVNNPLGTLLSQGFAYDGEAPIAINLWNQPTYDPNANDQKGSAWRVNFTGVDQAAMAVPEPESVLLVGLALGLVAVTSRRRRTVDDDAGHEEAVPAAARRSSWPALVDIAV